MDTNRMPEGMIPGMASGMLGLEMPLHQNPQQQQQMMSFGTHDNDLHLQSQQTVMKQQPYHYNTKDKQQQQQWSDEDEPGFNGDDGGGGDGKKRTSPWQRMKWTDNMVKLLIMVVFYIGDDGGGEAIATATTTDPSGTGKKKSGGLLQKKGKWKTVSKAMMEKGFYVSPQQCEDKFNDLNKRYKRVNDILGKGTACKVVENQSLLETMDNISPKMKKEVKKLLNSKHLFFREMCAYHNTCAAGGAAAFASAHQSAAEVAVEPTHHQSQQRCFHSSEANTILANSRGRADSEGLKVGRGGSREEEGDDEDDDDDDEDDDDEDEDEEEDETEESRGHKNHDGYRGAEEEVLGSRKRQRRGGSSASPSSLSPAMHQLSSELFSVLQDGTKSEWEQRQWMRNKLYQLEEQKVRYQYEAFKLEKQRLKWIKFSGKKEREMEKTKLENDRIRLENERMVLLLRQKELELLDLQRQQEHHQQLSSNRRPDPSSITG